MRKWLIVLLLLAITPLAALLPTLAQTTDADTETIRAALADVPGLVEVAGVTISDEEGDQPVLLVKYITAETLEIGYYAEIIDAFRAIGETLPDTAIDVESVVIYTGVTVDDVLERLEVSADVLADFVDGELTRSDFWGEVDTVGLEHQLPDHADPGDEV